MVHLHSLSSAHHVRGVLVEYLTSPGVAGITRRKRRSPTCRGSLLHQGSRRRRIKPTLVRHRTSACFDEHRLVAHEARLSARVALIAATSGVGSFTSQDGGRGRSRRLEDERLAQHGAHRRAREALSEHEPVSLEFGIAEEFVAKARRRLPLPHAHTNTGPGGLDGSVTITWITP
jgi:hypothetical protein